MKEEHIVKVVDLMDRALNTAEDNEAELAVIRKEVNALMEGFPLFPNS